MVQGGTYTPSSERVDLELFLKWGKKGESLFVEWNRRKDLWMVVSHLRSQFTFKISLLDLNKSSFAFPGCWVSLLILPVGSSDHYSEPFHLCHTGTMRHRRNGNFESSRLLCSSMSRSMDVSYNDSVSIRYILDKLGYCLGSGPQWLQNRSCQEKFDWFVSFPFMEFSQASEPSGNNGTLLTCWKSKGVCIPFDLYKFFVHC